MSAATPFSRPRSSSYVSWLQAGAAPPAAWRPLPPGAAPAAVTPAAAALPRNARLSTARAAAGWVMPLRLSQAPTAPSATTSAGHSEKQVCHQKRTGAHAQAARCCLLPQAGRTVGHREHFLEERSQANRPTHLPESAAARRLPARGTRTAAPAPLHSWACTPHRTAHAAAAGARQRRSGQGSGLRRGYTGGVGCLQWPA